MKNLIKGVLIWDLDLEEAEAKEAEYPAGRRHRFAGIVFVQIVILLYRIKEVYRVFRLPVQTAVYL